METCPNCSCLINEDKCVICGYRLEKTNIEKNISKSVFDIFDFIDNKDNNYIKEDRKNIFVKNNKKVKVGIKYKKQQYIQIKCENHLKQEVKNNSNTSRVKNINKNNPTIINQKNKKSFKISTIIYIILFFIKPSLCIIFIVIGGIIENVSKTKNKE